VVTISGQKHWLWRAVDQDGYVLDEIVQDRRDTKAAKRLLKRLLRKQGCPPRRMITDKLGSYMGSPGMEMEGTAPDTYEAVLFGPSGRKTFARYERARLL
jgi:putative transposase